MLAVHTAGGELFRIGVAALLLDPAGSTRSTEGFALFPGLTFISAVTWLGIRYWNYLRRLDRGRAGLEEHAGAKP